MTNKPARSSPPISRTLLLGAILIAIIALTMMLLLNMQQNPSLIETPTITQTLTTGED